MLGRLLLGIHSVKKYAIKQKNAPITGRFVR
jgi:hypothetical protein